jgi:hypothetical protein
MVIDVNMSGKFEFLVPFNVYNTNKELTIISKVDIAELLQGNQDIFNLVYAPVKLTQEDMYRDIQNNVKLITLKDTGNKFYYIPENKLSFANVTDDSVLYQGKGIVINLGGLKYDENIDNLVLDIQELIESTIGISPKIEIVYTTAPTNISKDVADGYESKREIKRVITTSYYTLYKSTLKLLEEKDHKIKQLECYIKNNC